MKWLEVQKEMYPQEKPRELQRLTDVRSAPSLQSSSPTSIDYRTPTQDSNEEANSTVSERSTTPYGQNIYDKTPSSTSAVSESG
uniref:Uncharacterized protein n=1 Tax=Knipowitschia caucasica TaxID=637954 RepID=A0AAV2KSW3_KNICA